MASEGIGSKIRTMLGSRAGEIVAAIVLVGFGFAIGRWAAPSKVVTQEKVRVVETEKVVTVEKVVTQRVQDTQKDKRVHREEYEVRHPDGTDEKKTTTDENVNTVVKETEYKYIDRWNERVVEKEVYRDKEKIVERNAANWSLAVGAGLSIPEATGRTAGYRLLDPLGGVILVGEIDRRFLGPISLGVWGTTSGEAGLKVRLDF